MAQKGRPPKKPVSKKIEDALGAAQDEIDNLMPEDVQKDLIPEVQSPEVIEEPSPRITKDAKDDYEFARSNLHSLLLKGNEILEGITELAQSSEHPRTFEVAGTVLKTLLEGTRELMTLQKDIRDIEKKTADAQGVDDGPTPVTINNAEHVTNNVVVETTTMEMLEILERAKKQKKLEDEEKRKGEN